ncbi:hypothetical protein A6A08_01040 [Nocardiopsis sp. TSRI0078]|uniref:DUF4229 domain-containing protein n=1 Tax=unclassified Nocardiopsis TaxID=2649073 RepID=UPI00093EFF5D|nr:DUF4229 domain-containing protein [Nocardiopsis sp. TSRI0078]OKI23418.1 hypothetical protein A6A08_01040 [Nocardiopsis sp. TSRI0078]
MRSLLTYTAARLGLFAVAFGVVYLFGARSLVALVLAWLISGLASYVLLSRLRDQVSASAVERIESRRARLSAAAAREDALQEPGEAPSAGADGDVRADGGAASDAEEKDTGASEAARKP